MAEIRLAVADGATEIDAVIDRSLVLRETGAEWARLSEEIASMREACGAGVQLKVILSTGELGNERNIYGASMAAMMAGAHWHFGPRISTFFLICPINSQFIFNIDSLAINGRRDSKLWHLLKMIDHTITKVFLILSFPI